MAIPSLGFSRSWVGDLLRSRRLSDVILDVSQFVPLGWSGAKEDLCWLSELHHTVDAQRGVLDRAQEQRDLARGGFTRADQHRTRLGFGVEFEISRKSYFSQHFLLPRRSLVSSGRIDLDLDLSSGSGPG